MTTTGLLPITDILNTADVIGSVNGDVTTITSITYEQTPLESISFVEFLCISVEDFPSITIIDGVQYRWTVKSTFQPKEGGTYVSNAVLNIGTRLVINKPFFDYVYGTDPINNGTTGTFSFYSLGNYTASFASFDVTDFYIDGKTAVPITIRSSDPGAGFNNLSEDATYRFIWELGDKSYSIDKKLGSGATELSASYTPPISWNEEIPNSDNGSMTVRVRVIFGTWRYYGVYRSITARVPDSCVPTLSGFAIADTRGRVPASWGMFVQSNSNIALASLDYAISYGSQISKVVMDVNGKSYSGTMSSLPSTPTLTEYGVMDVTVKITDQRGRTAEKTAKVTVVQYRPPTLEAESDRCDQSGTLSDDGVYFLAITETSYSTCNGKNTLSLKMWYKQTGEADYTGNAKTLPVGSGTTVCGGDLDPEYSYDVKYELSDAFNTITLIGYVSTAIYAMHFLHGGHGVAFGQKATVENAVDFAFDAIFRGSVKFVKENGEEVTIQQIINALGL